MTVTNFIEGVGVLLLVVTIAFAPFFGLYYLIRYVVNFFDKRIYGKKIDIKYAELILSSKFPYYQKLDDKQRTRFLRRLLNFIDNKDFHGSGGLTLTDEMTILISASAIQLTFGLTEFRLDHFSRIFVYPKAFYSKISKQYHKGETNLAGAIALSWSDFSDGLNKPHDKINLGLHEMAHALRFDKFKSDDYDQFFNTYYDKWHMIAQDEFIKLKDNSASFFREYGGSNFNEFFAVCIETFFEQPKEFKNLYPEIYRHLSILLNQDPLQSNTYDELRQVHDPSFEPGGKLFYKTGVNITNFISLIFVAGMWSFLFVQSVKDGISAELLVMSILMLVPGYFITIRAFRKILFYENGILVKTVLPNLIPGQTKFSYDEVICIEFDERSSAESNDTIGVTYLEKGRIKTRNFTDDFSRNEVIEFADYLVNKKVAVKLNAFARYSRK